MKRTICALLLCLTIPCFILPWSQIIAIDPNFHTSKIIAQQSGLQMMAGSVSWFPNEMGMPKLESLPAGKGLLLALILFGTSIAVTGANKVLAGGSIGFAGLLCVIFQLMFANPLHQAHAKSVAAIDTSKYISVQGHRVKGSELKEFYTDYVRRSTPMLPFLIMGIAATTAFIVGFIPSRPKHPKVTLPNHGQISFPKQS